MNPGFWIVGDFEGEFEGFTARPRSEDARLPPGGRAFTIRVLRGQIRNAKRLEGAPPEPPSGWVVRQSVLASAWLDPPQADNQGATLTETELRDVEFHDLVVERQIEEPARGLWAYLRGREAAAGIVRGRIYGRLPDPPSADPAPPVMSSIAPTSAVETDINPPARSVVAGRTGANATRRELGTAGACLWPGWLPTLFALLFLLALWVYCGPRLALIWLGGIVLARLLRCIRLHSGWFMPPHWAEFPAAWVLTGLHILALVWIIRLAMRNQCAHLWPPLLLPFALPLVATGFLPVRAARIVCVLVWSVGVLGWCSSKGGRCFGPVTSLRERVEDTMSHDPRADQVFEATRHESAKRQRVSLDQALEDPESFFQNCDRALYLSDDVLFDWDQSTLKPESAPQLRKLKRLLAHRPDAHIRLDGHADASGDAVHNARLSERRARAVALWLETEAGIPAERIETVGRGASQPLVDAPSLRHLNRRVEVAVPCSSTTAPGPARDIVNPGNEKCREPVDSGTPLIVR